MRFETYENAIKRYGYTGRINDQILNEVASEIHLNPKDLTDRATVSHFYYQADHSFNHGNYDSQKILLLGLLLCGHRDTIQAAEALWGIVNPSMLTVNLITVCYSH